PPPPPQPGPLALPRGGGDTGQPRRELSLKQIYRRGPPVDRCDENESLGLAEHPMIPPAFALGCEEGAIDQTVLAGLLEIVGQKPLKAGQGARPFDPEYRRLTNHEHGSATKPFQPAAGVAALTGGHQPTADRQVCDRPDPATPPRHQPAHALVP